MTVNVTGEYVPVFILNVDFEDGNDGNYSVSGSAKAYGNVVDKNGNMVLEVNSNDPDAHGFVEIPLNGNYKKLTMSYHLGLSNTDGVFYIPTLSSCVTVATKAGGNLEDTIDGNSWIQLTTTDANKTGATYEAMTWHTVKIMYDATGIEPTVRFFLDGVEYSVRDKNAGSVNKVNMQLTKWMGTQIAYIDNIRVSEEDHEPAAKPTQSMYVKAESVAFPEPTMTIDANVPTILTVNFTPAGASEKGVTFTSSDISIASFDALGYLVGHKAGTVTITADPVEEGLENATLQLTVVVTDVTKVEIQSEDLTLPAGGNAFISAVLTPDNATFGDPLYSSSDTSIAVIDSFGQILALKAGTVTITAAAEDDPTVFDSITLTVTEPEVMRTIYVAPNGTTIAAGTKDAPVDLEGALALIAANNDNMTGNIEVILAGGYYHLSETLEITDAHGGNNNYSVIWKAAEGETPVIGSAYTVSGAWTEDKETGIWSISVPEWLDSRQLYVNNVRATRARSEIGLARCGFLYDASGNNIGYTCSNVELADFTIVEDLELVFKEQWTQPRIGVTSITDNGDGSINMILDQPGWGAVSNKGGTSAGSDGPVWLENAIELLDDAGEWYLDTKNDKLYYMPRPWEDMAEVKVTLPTIDGEMITIVGTDLDANRVQNIHFEGITFADTTWMRPSTNNGHSDAQDNHIRQGGDFLPTAAVVVKQANAIWFTDCTFTRLGINALQMIDGVQNSFIVGNHFYDISGDAINIGEPDTGSANAFAQGNAMMKNNDILNNYIHNIGVDFGSSAAISVGFAAEMDMSHNEIFDVPYSGWHIGYGWYNRFSNNNKNMLLEYNFVHDFMDQGIYDGGGIYVLGNTSGDGYNIARYNYFRNQMNAHGALYPDQGTTFFKFIENVIDLSEVDSWVNNTPPKWSHINMKTLHVHFINNYSTTDYKTYSNEINFETDDIVYGELIVDPEAKWEGTNAPAIMAAAGLERAYTYLRNGQAERIVLNAGEEDMLMKAGETYTLRVGFTDGKDNSVSGGDVTVAYDSKDPAVATVSDSGVITAVGAGVTTIRVWIVSNDVLDVCEITVFVDDSLAEVKLDGVLGDISMSKDAVGKAYTATLYTALGRELEPETVTFAIANTAVATVSADGYLLPAGVGTTTLTVTATLNGESVSTIYKVTITDGVAFEEDDAWEMFDKELEPEWYHNGSSDWVLVDNTSIDMKLHGYVTFTGAKYADELLSFKLKVDTSTGGGSWTPAIVLRAQGTNSYVSAGVDGYILCMGKGGLELYRYVNNVRHVIYGDFDENHADVIAGKADISCKQGGKLTDTAWTFDANGVAEHDIKIGAISDGGDVRIVLYVDGQEVINYLDKAENGAFSDAGYIGFIGRSEKWTITKNTDISDVEPSAMVGDTAYATAQEALEAAKEGDTVKLLTDAEFDSLILAKGVTVDLNGYDLYAEYLVAFDGNGFVDSVDGVGLLKCKNVRLAANNPDMPVWDDLADGYRLFTMKSQQKYRNQTEDGFEFIAKPVLGSHANDIFMAQSETNGLTIKVRLNWTSNSGKAVEQFFILDPADMATIYSKDTNVIQLNVTGAGSYVDKLYTTCYIESETGVVWAPNGRLYIGE